MEYGVFILEESFFNLFTKKDYYNLNLKMKKRRPYLLLDIPNEKYPDCYYMVPFGSEKDDNKLENFAKEYPDMYYRLDIENHIESYLLIQGSLYVKKKFVKERFIVGKAPVVIKNISKRKEIVKLIKEFQNKVIVKETYKNMKFSSIPLKIVYDRQNQ